LGVFKKYAEFDGRSRRAEFWYFFLFNLIASAILGFIGSMMGDRNNILSSLYSLVVLIPSFAVFFRRMHDLGKSGWWWLMGLIPVIGTIWLIVLLATDGNSGENKYGPDPKGVTTI